MIRSAVLQRELEKKKVSAEYGPPSMYYVWVWVWVGVGVGGWMCVCVLNRMLWMTRVFPYYVLYKGFNNTFLPLVSHSAPSCVLPQDR